MCGCVWECDEIMDIDTRTYNFLIAAVIFVSSLEKQKVIYFSAGKLYVGHGAHSHTLCLSVSHQSIIIIHDSVIHTCIRISAGCRRSGKINWHKYSSCSFSRALAHANAGARVHTFFNFAPRELVRDSNSQQYVLYLIYVNVHGIVRFVGILGVRDWCLYARALTLPTDVPSNSLTPVCTRIHEMVAFFEFLSQLSRLASAFITFFALFLAAIRALHTLSHIHCVWHSTVRNGRRLLSGTRDDQFAVNIYIYAIGKHRNRISLAVLLVVRRRVVYTSF